LNINEIKVYYLKLEKSPSFFMRLSMLNLKCLNFSLPGDQEDMARRFEDCSTSIQQIVHCIETVEAQLREKRQTIEEIRARHEALAGELASAVGDLGSVLSAHGMLSDDAPISISGGVQGSSEPANDSEHLHYDEKISDKEVDPDALKAGILRVIERKRRPDAKATCPVSRAETVQGTSS
jgi:hypothetical protein